MKKSSLNKMAKMQSKIEDIRIILEELHESESESFNSRSERYQESEKGQIDDEILSYLESTVQNLCDAYDNLGNVELDSE